MKHLFISFVLAFTSIFIACAKNVPSRPAQNTTAKINRTWIEPGTVRDGRQGITIHADIDIDDAKGRLIGCQAMFYSSPGGWSLRDKNGQYRVSPSLNYVAAFHFFRSDERSVRGRDDISIFIPIEELHIKGTHKYRIYTQLTLYADPGKNGMFLAESDYLPVIIDLTNSDKPRALNDNSGPVSVAQAKELKKSDKRRGIVAIDKTKKKPKKEKQKNKDKKTYADNARTTRNSSVKKEAIDAATFWEKEEIDSLSLPKIYIE